MHILLSIFVLLAYVFSYYMVTSWWGLPKGLVQQKLQRYSKNFFKLDRTPYSSCTQQYQHTERHVVTVSIHSILA